jgi:hypothetical protein
MKFMALPWCRHRRLCATYFFLKLNSRQTRGQRVLFHVTKSKHLSVRICAFGGYLAALAYCVLWCAMGMVIVAILLSLAPHFSPRG